MQTRLVALALSVPVVLTALPAQAQMRHAIPVQAVAPGEPGAVRPRNELRVFIGPGFELGPRGLAVSRSQTRSVADTTTAGTTTTTSASSSALVNTNSAFGEGLGVVYGVEGTWWGADRLGIGAGLFGAYLGAGNTTNVLALNGQPASTYVPATSGAQTTTVTDTFTLTTNVPSAPAAYGVSITGAGGAGNTVVSTGYTGFTTPAGGAGGVTLRTGSDTPANPQTTYSSTGGVSYNFARTRFLNDFTVHGDYVLAATPAGGLSFFGGFTMPTGLEHRGFQAKTVGANGNGNDATETETRTIDANNTASVNRIWTYNESYTADTSMLAMGPVVGLNAYYTLPRGLRLYTQLGYAPVLVGSATTNSSSTLNNTSTAATKVTGTVPGYTAGTVTGRNQTTTPGQGISPLSGSEALGSIGVGFGLGGLNLFAEGTARGYTFVGQQPDLIYALKLGGIFNF